MIKTEYETLDPEETAELVLLNAGNHTTLEIALAQWLLLSQDMAQERVNERLYDAGRARQSRH